MTQEEVEEANEARANRHRQTVGKGRFAPRAMPDPATMDALAAQQAGAATKMVAQDLTPTNQQLNANPEALITAITRGLVSKVGG